MFLIEKMRSDIASSRKQETIITFGQSIGVFEISAAKKCCQLRIITGLYRFTAASADCFDII